MPDSEKSSVIGPSALLGAAHRDDGDGLLPEENGCIEHPVLLGSEELLAVEDEHGPVCIVRDLEFRHMAAFAHLGYCDESLLDGLFQHEVLYRRPKV